MKKGKKKEGKAERAVKTSGNEQQSEDEVEIVSAKSARTFERKQRKLLKKNLKKIESRQAEELELLLDDLRDALDAKADEATRSRLYYLADIKASKVLGFAAKGAVREYAESILLAVLFALVLRAFVIEAFKIPTKSMVPTLLEGDHLFVNKFAYGLRLPFTTIRLVDFGQPERGEVVVFVFPRESAAEHINMHGRECLDRASLQEEKDYIKRVIGVAGDTIEVVDNVILINGEPIQRSLLYSREVVDHTFPLRKRKEFWSEETLGEATYLTISRENSIGWQLWPSHCSGRSYLRDG